MLYDLIVCICENILCEGILDVIVSIFVVKGTYCMSCGNDRTIRLWNPHRDGLDGPGTALLVKSYKGLHGYDVQDVAM